MCLRIYKKFRLVVLHTYLEQTIAEAPSRFLRLLLLSLLSSRVHFIRGPCFAFKHAVFT